MNVRPLAPSIVALVLLATLAAPSARAQVAPPRAGLAAKTFVDPVLRVPAVHAAATTRLAAGSAADVDAFLGNEGRGWHVIADATSGHPALLEGRGIDWLDARQATSAAALDAMEARARAFLAAYPRLFGVAAKNLALRRGASGPLGEALFTVDFALQKDGIAVDGAHLVFRLNHGRLVQFGQELVGPALAALDTTPKITPAEAWNAVWAHAGKRGDERKAASERLAIVPVASGGALDYRLVHVLVFTRPGETGTFESRVDAHTGALLSFRDVNDYGHAHGGVYAGDRPALEVDRPFPFVDLGSGLYADGAGRFAGNAAHSALNGQFALIVDSCSDISLDASAGDLDFGRGPGLDCDVAGMGSGTTHAARTQYYNLNQVKTKARTYLPTNTWLNGSVMTQVNLAETCNAYWSPVTGTLNFFASGGGCDNTGELPGVSLHEFGHGLDSNDGNGASPDNGTGETYGDFTAALSTHASCGGNGFFLYGNCQGYGNACLACTGVRDIDWAARHDNVPSTPQMLGGTSGYRCNIDAGYPGPCGYEGHCESYISSEALWDLAARDLPAAGLDPATAWQLVDRLWFTSRPTATAAYSCPTTDTTDGCGIGSLFSVLRAADDADGDLSNGTPHAAAIFAAFNRHRIACASVNNADQASACPALAPVTLSGQPANESASLSWTASAGAARYQVLRNELGCGAGYTKIGETTTTAYTDTTPSNGVTYYYRVQPLGTTDACAGAVSNCLPLAPLPCAGTPKFGKAVANCADVVAVTLDDSDLVGQGTQVVHAWSTLETAPETLTLIETPALSGHFVGQLATGSTSAPNDGALAVADGSTITVRYDELDACGAGPRTVDSVLGVDCHAPIISNVQVHSTDIAATITWTTDEPSTSRVTWGAAKPPGTVKEDTLNLVTSHSITIDGLTPCTTYYFSVASSDQAANTGVDDGAGSFHPFVSGGIAYLLHDDVENGQGTWSVTTNQGSAFHIDTCKSHSATHAWKAGAPVGTCPGEYAAGTGTYLTSSTLDLGAPGHGYHLRYWEWGKTEVDGYGTIRDFCTVQISTDGGTTWVNVGTPYGGDSHGWVFTDYDLAAWSGNVRIRFWFESDWDWQFEGWYLDDIEVSRVVACGPELHFQSKQVQDYCTAGGSSSNNGVADAGEYVTLPVSLVNQGPAGASGVSATLSTAAAGVTITNALATYPVIASQANGGSIAPHFAVKLGTGLACGTVVPFNMHIVSDQGPRDDSFNLTVGAQTPGTPVNVLEEHFNAAGPNLPAGWTTEKVSGNLWNVPTYQVYSCTGSSTNYSLRYPYSTSQNADSWAFTKALTLKAGTTYTLSFKQRVGYVPLFGYGETLTVKLGTTPHAAGMTSTLWTQSALKNDTCIARTADFTVPADGTYYVGFWSTSPAGGTDILVDDVIVSYTPLVCTMNTCNASPLAVPDETSLLQWSPTRDTLSWPATPNASAYRLYEGSHTDLAGLPTPAPDSCLRWNGPATTTGPVLHQRPAAKDILWYLVTAVNAAGEGTAGPGRHVDSRGTCP